MKKGLKIFFKILGFTALTIVLLAVCFKFGFSIVAKFKLEDGVKVKLEQSGLKAESVSFSILPPKISLKQVSITNTKYNYVIFCERMKVKSSFSQLFAFSKLLSEDASFSEFSEFKVIAKNISLSPDIDYNNSILLFKAKKFKAIFNGKIVDNKFSFENQKLDFFINDINLSYNGVVSDRVIKNVFIEKFYLKNRFSKRKSFLKNSLFINFGNGSVVKGVANSNIAYPKLDFNFSVNYPVFFDTNGKGTILLSKKDFFNSKIHNSEVVFSNFNPLLKDYFYEVIFHFAKDYNVSQFYNSDDLKFSFSGNVRKPVVECVK